VFAGSLDNFLYAIDAADGRIRWRWRTGGDVVGVPVVTSDRVYFASLDNVLRALDRSHGAQRWKRPLPTRPVGGPHVVGTELLVPLVSAEIAVVDAREGTSAKPVALGAEPATPVVPVSAAAGQPPTNDAFVVVTRDGRAQLFRKSVPPPAAPPAAR
jgi:outer membrane protein assembly factor BamB